MTAKHTAHASAVTVLSTEINSLGDGSNKITTIALSNDAAGERDLFGHFQLSLAATATRTGASVDMFILPEIDGSFVSGSDTVDPEQGYVGTFSFDLTANARVAEIRNVSLPNSNYHVLLQNNLGVAFAAIGSTLQLETSGYEDV